MRKRSVIVSGGLAVLMVAGASMTPVSVAGQAKPDASNYKVPKTAWGEPDFQGIWTTNEMHGVPNERPKEFADKPTLTEKEALDRRERTTQGTVGAEGIGNYDRAFRDTALGYTKQRVSAQSALVIDPPDGRFPPLTAEAQKRRGAGGGETGGADIIRMGRPAEWNEVGGWGRCITRGARTLVEPSGYNNGVQIVQSPGVVAIQKEMIHETRVIPINAGPHVGSNLKSWAGDARGRWEGDTLVVDITNFDGRAGLQGAGREAKLTERYRRLGPNELEYLFTVEDPATWTRPWTGRMTLSLDPEQYELVEYACHEANYSMLNSLSAARAEEKAERDAQTKKPAAR